MWSDTEKKFCQKPGAKSGITLLLGLMLASKEVVNILNMLIINFLPDFLIYNAALFRFLSSLFSFLYDPDFRFL